MNYQKERSQKLITAFRNTFDDMEASMETMWKNGGDLLGTTEQWNLLVQIEKHIKQAQKELIDVYTAAIGRSVVFEITHRRRKRKSDDFYRSPTGE